MDIAIIGCGRVARVVHVPALREAAPDCRLRLFDIRQDIANELLAQVPGAVSVSSIDEALEGVSLAVVCTPNSTHAEYVGTCIERGISCLCEKPVTHRPGVIGPLSALLDGAKSEINVNLPYAVSPVFENVSGLFDMGQWTDIELEFSTLGLRFWRPLTDWYGEPMQSGGGAILDLGTHAIHFLEQASRSEFDVVACTASSAPQEDTATIEAFLGGIPARLIIDRRARRPAFCLRLQHQDGTKWACDVLKGELHVDGELAGRHGVFDSQGAVKMIASGCIVERLFMATALSAEKKAYAAYAAIGQQVTG